MRRHVPSPLGASSIGFPKTLPEFSCASPRLTGFYWVLLGFTGFYWVLLSFTGFSQGFLVFTKFFSISLDFFSVLLGFR